MKIYICTYRCYITHLLRHLINIYMVGFFQELWNTSMNKNRQKVSVFLGEKRQQTIIWGEKEQENEYQERVAVLNRIIGIDLYAVKIPERRFAGDEEVAISMYGEQPLPKRKYPVQRASGR